MTNRQAAIQIVRTLRKHGHQALFAGGCVRDMLLSRTPKDYDVATSATPQQVESLFSRTIQVGAQFGVMIVLIESEQVEVATFRLEAGYHDGRRPSEVVYSNAKEDSLRRDFTINGMFYDPLEKQIIDYVNGQVDISARRIRTIGNPNDRFGEDYLRMLRAVRFSTQLGFEIEHETWRAVQSLANKIEKISRERIAMELEAMLTHPNRRQGVQLLEKSGLSQVIFGSIAPEILVFGAEVLSLLPASIDFSLALAGFFAGMEASQACKLVRTLKLSNRQYKGFRFLMEHRGVLLNAEMGLAELRKLLAQPYFEDLYEYQNALQNARGLPVTSLRRIKTRAKELEGLDLCPQPLLNGHELIRLGVAPGPMVGLVGREMYPAQLSEEVQNSEQADEWVKIWPEKHKEITE